MKAVVAKFAAYVKVHEQRTGHPYGKAEDVDERKKFLSLDITEEENEVVLEHGVRAYGRGKVKGYAMNIIWNIAQIKLISLLAMFDLNSRMSDIGMILRYEYSS